jgi:hypothetical protein
VVVLVLLHHLAGDLEDGLPRLDLVPIPRRLRGELGHGPHDVRRGRLGLGTDAEVARDDALELRSTDPLTTTAATSGRLRMRRTTSATQ